MTEPTHDTVPTPAELAAWLKCEHDEYSGYRPAGFDRDRRYAATMAVLDIADTLRHIEAIFSNITQHQGVARHV